MTNTGEGVKLTDAERLARINSLGGYQRVFDAIAAATKPWPSREQCTGISVSVFDFIEALEAGRSAICSRTKGG